MVAFVLSDRRKATCRKLWVQIPTAYQGCQSYISFWEAINWTFLRQPTTVWAKTVGKSFLATALGRAVCAAEYDVRYFRTSRLL